MTPTAADWAAADAFLNRWDEFASERCRADLARAIADRLGANLAERGYCLIPVAIVTEARDVIRDEWMVALTSFCECDAGGCPDVSTLEADQRPYVARLERTMRSLTAALGEGPAA